MSNEPTQRFIGVDYGTVEMSVAAAYIRNGDQWVPLGEVREINLSTLMPVVQSFDMTDGCTIRGPLHASPELQEWAREMAKAITEEEASTQTKPREPKKSWKQKQRELPGFLR